MTISYSGNLWRILLRWRGSLWKAVWKELLVFLSFYYAVRLVYRHLLDADSAADFENVVLTFEAYAGSIPLTFLLGFYIMAIITRWWNQFERVAWPDELLTLICFLLPATEPESRSRRHRIARYLCLTCALVWRDISVKVRQRFPTMEHLVKFGLMTEAEKQLFNQVPTDAGRWYLPLLWVQHILQGATRNTPAPLTAVVLKELQDFRITFRKLYCYDWVCVPLVYTQVTTVATYGYFALSIIGGQFLKPEKGFKHHEVDYYIPLFTVMQFVFYIGWFKVGQDLMNPFGNDDDDIELNYILDRHVQACFCIANDDVMSREPPSEQKDRLWGLNPVKLGHTRLSAKVPDHAPKLHAVVRFQSPSDGDAVEKNLRVSNQTRLRPF